MEGQQNAVVGVLQRGKKQKAKGAWRRKWPGDLFTAQEPEVSYRFCQQDNSLLTVAWPPPPHVGWCSAAYQVHIHPHLNPKHPPRVI